MILSSALLLLLLLLRLLPLLLPPQGRLLVQELVHICARMWQRIVLPLQLRAAEFTSRVLGAAGAHCSALLQAVVLCGPGPATRWRQALRAAAGLLLLLPLPLLHTVQELVPFLCCHVALHCMLAIAIFHTLTHGAGSPARCCCCCCCCCCGRLLDAAGICCIHTTCCACCHSTTGPISTGALLLFLMQHLL
jgi:hypothetical protein